MSRKDLTPQTREIGDGSRRGLYLGEDWFTSDNWVPNPRGTRGLILPYAHFQYLNRAKNLMIWNIIVKEERIYELTIKEGKVPTTVYYLQKSLCERCGIFHALHLKE